MGAGGAGWQTRGAARAGSRLSPESWELHYRRLDEKLERLRATFSKMIRPRPLSVAEVAAALQVSDAYVRRLLISQRLYGIKVGSVWVVYEEDLETFRRLRRPRGRPRKVTAPEEPDIAIRITSEQAPAGANDGLDLVSRRRPNSAKPGPSSRRHMGGLDIS